MPIWSPPPERVARANLTAFIAHLRGANLPGAEAIGDYASLYDWSIARRDLFWPAVARFCGIHADGPGPDP